MKPYQKIPIQDCGDPLVAIPEQHFAFEIPHPYQKLGAPYKEVSPYMLRQGVLEALKQAQKQLQIKQPGWRIKIFDAYRPVAVQQFMVDYTFQTLRQQLPHEPEEAIAQQVAQFWAQPSENPETPPPHSTGAAIDIALVNEQGETLDLGSEIDELSSRSYPDFYQAATGHWEQLYQQRRALLKAVMVEAGFRQHPQEWWHFSCGDQMWAWLKRQEVPQEVMAYYGRVSEN
ncbi:MAG: D-alanyl-D-alanine dipeptidase [Cyanobacteria bacterium SW_9_44_58]|nr:MAG: D-alanyl-D-alanine dipeptidase [Cyanobacteria bacterium SW_9_44_58]